MSWFSAIPIVGKVLDGVIGLVDQVVEDKDEANKLKAQLELVFKNADLTKFTEQIRAQKDIIVAEAKSDSWVTRSWRPIIMLLFGAIILNNYIFNPYLAAMFNVDVMMPIPPEMWQLLKIGMGGYIVGRSAQECVKSWKGKNNGKEM